MVKRKFNLIDFLIYFLIDFLMSQYWISFIVWRQAEAVQ